MLVITKCQNCHGEWKKSAWLEWSRGRVDRWKFMWSRTREWKNEWGPKMRGASGFVGFYGPWIGTVASLFLFSYSSSFFIHFIFYFLYFFFYHHKVQNPEKNRLWFILCLVKICFPPYWHPPFHLKSFFRSSQSMIHFLIPYDSLVFYFFLYLSRPLSFLNWTSSTQDQRTFKMNFSPRQRKGVACRRFPHCRAWFIDLPSGLEPLSSSRSHRETFLDSSFFLQFVHVVIVVVVALYDLDIFVPFVFHPHLRRLIRDILFFAWKPNISHYFLSQQTRAYV